jgi:hypothetical protein
MLRLTTRGSTMKSPLQPGCEWQGRPRKTELHSIGRTYPILSLAAFLGVGMMVRADSTSPTEWPRVWFRDGVTNTIYQPQLDSWDYFTLKATSAVSVQPQGATQPIFGAIHFVARTRVDRAEREVYFETIDIAQVDFPSAGKQENTYLAALRSLLPKQVKTISLDRLEASLAILGARQKASGVPLNNVPPVILFSTAPAVLILVDGPPVYLPIEGTPLERVFNTRALILRDRSGKYYLHLFDGYVEAPDLSGPWTVAGKVPGDVKKVEKAAVQARQVDLLAGQENPETKKLPSLESTPVPKLYLATGPTELIVLQGEPQWTPIPSTQLLYVTNTVAHVFKNLTDQQVYVLLSGRWFRSTSFKGPWDFVPGASLPKDFTKIPDDGPQENVKASVPGTPQAEEAIIANSIPQSVKVDWRQARMDPAPQYDGVPQLKKIEGTPLSYVVNCQLPVVQVDAKTWYACQSGVWFVAADANGPWMVATNVPPEIYSIPPSSPIYYVVYARICNYDPDYVWVGITPGLYGAIVGPDGTVVYGTGYRYPPYVSSTMYVSYPVTYGYGSDLCWTPWTGWAFGFAAGFAVANDWYWWCCCPPAPYWGPYWGYCYGAYYNAYGGITAWGPYGWAGTSGYIYYQGGPWTGVSRAAAGYNAWTGNQWATQYGRAYNSITGTRVVGQRGAVENVYTGNYAYGGRAALYNEQTGAAGAGGKVTWGNENTGNQGSAGRMTIHHPNTGNTTHIGGGKNDQGGFINVNGNVIVGKDGTYYRPDGSGGWEQITRPPAGGNTPGAGGQPIQSGQQQWQKSNVGNQQRQSLNNELNAQQMGAQRQRSFQMNRPSFSRGGFRR